MNIEILLKGKGGRTDRVGEKPQAIEPGTLQGLEKVLSDACSRAGLMHDFVTLQITNTCDGRCFQGTGIRLTGVEPDAPGQLPMVIGYRGNMFHASLSYNPGAAMKITHLYDHFYQRLGGHTYRVKVHAPDPAQVAKNFMEVLLNPHLPSPTVPKPTESIVMADTHADKAAGIDLGPEPVDPRTGTGLKDPRNLHSAVVALLARFGLQEIFTFTQFLQVLQEKFGIEIDNSNPGNKLYLLPIFTRPGYVMRINQHPNPGRYQMTPEAQRFAQGPVPEAIPVKRPRPYQRRKPPLNEKLVEREGLVSRRRAAPDPVPSSPFLPASSFTSEAARLKARESEYQGLFTRWESLSNKLRALNLKEVEAEGERLEVRSRAITDELRRIEKRRAEISEIKEQARRFEQEMALLDQAKEEPGLKADHKAYTQAREALR